jgi:transcription termination/antitermination protein NusG
MSEEERSYIFALRTTANREDQVLDFVAANAERKGIDIYSLFRPHGLRGYIFIEAPSRQAAEESISRVPYARGLLSKHLEYSEVESMLEQAKTEVNIRKNDIVEIITGPFKREKAKVVRIDQVKEEVIVELLEAAVPIPITVKLDSVRVIRREEGAEENE